MGGGGGHKRKRSLLFLFLQVSKVKALDVYFGLCFIYVFGALIEFACVCYFDKHFKTKNSQKAEQEKAKSQELERERRNQHIIRTIDSWTPRDARFHFTLSIWLMVWLVAWVTLCSVWPRVTKVISGIFEPHMT